MPRRLRQVVRPLIAAVVAVAYVVLILGLPLPVVKPVGEAAERFPCENCGCGCRTAEQCWNHCCCFTPAQRLAWAAQNGVTPPASVVRLASAEAAGSEATCTTGSTCCCCGPAKPASSVVREPRKGQENRVDFVLGWRVLSCQGRFLQWLASVPLGPVPQGVSIVRHEAWQWLALPTTTRYVPCASAPEVPPPEIAA